MKRSVFQLSLLITLVTFTTFAGAQSVTPRIIKWEEMEPLLHHRSHDTVYVINFWATWCRPCVHEMPSFDSLITAVKGKPVQVIFVSLDFKRQFESRLLPFVAEKKMQGMVYLLDEPDYDSWIDKVDKGWDGAIPATLIYKQGNAFREFYQQEFTYTELEKIIQPLIQ